MGMNRKGQVLVFAVMMFVLAFIAAVIFTTPLRDFVEQAQDEEHLGCENDTLTAGGLASCLVVDLTMPFFIATVVSAGSAYFFYKWGGG